jgi:hypothetical protein
MKLSTLHLNDSNPRVVRNERFKKLCESIKAFPKMMAIRPIVCNNNVDRVVLGGNMRMRACIANGMDDVPDDWVVFADRLTPEEQKRFIIADNVGFGEWDFDAIMNDWDVPLVMEFGLEIPDVDESDAVNSESVDGDPTNFLIRCSRDQIDVLKHKLNTTGNRMGYEQFITYLK